MGCMCNLPIQFFYFLFLFKKKTQAHHSIFFSPVNLYHNCPTLTSYLVMKRIINLCNKELNWKVFICDLLPYIYIYIYIVILHDSLGRSTIWEKANCKCFYVWKRTWSYALKIRRQGDA